MINVLELIDGGFLGGGQTHILSLVNSLDKDRYKAIIAASSDGDFGNAVRKNGFDFRSIELPKYYRSKHLAELDKIVRDNSIDIIHSHGGVAGMYARFYKKKFNTVKVIHTIHGIHYINSSNFIKKFLSLSIEQHLVPFTDRFICVSEADLETAKRIKIIDPEKTVVIKNGIDLNKFAAKKKKQSLLKSLNIQEGDFILGNISRFDYQKNQRYMISNLAEVLAKYPDVKILLAGDGKYHENCKSLAVRTGFEERIIFTGEVSNPEDYYPLFDIFIFPSLWEGLSISLIEAMASSNCIVASNIDANKELIKDDTNGYLFDIDNRKEFLEKIGALIENENLRQELSSQAKEDSKNYSETVMTKKIEDEYFKLLKN